MKAKEKKCLNGKYKRITPPKKWLNFTNLSHSYHSYLYKNKSEFILNMKFQSIQCII